MRSVAGAAARADGDFERVRAAFLNGPGLPFAEVLKADLVEEVFRKHDGLFGMGAIYSTVVTVWAFLGQALRTGKEAACQAAVAAVVAHQEMLGKPVPTSDTGDYCKARAKLPIEALRELVTRVAVQVEERADPAWFWKERHVKLIDGFNVTTPDTPSNQAEWPQMSSQKPGVGFPIVRAVAILSLATGCIRDLAIGPCEGKETGETALLRELLGSFDAGDVAVADRYYCSFLMIALLAQRKVDVCARMHQKRHVDFRKGVRLGQRDRLIAWTRPARPAWMDEATYNDIPETITLRMLRYDIVVPGRRTQSITIATTLTDAETYTREDIAELYGFRWNAELDIRSIKQSLGLDHMTCLSPDMIRRELWVTLLGYNLVRTTAAAAALLHRKKPRQISFTSTCQHILPNWQTIASGLLPADQLASFSRTLLARIAECTVGDRPGRIEPRVLKRRRQRYPLMTQPRAALRAQLPIKS